MTIVIGIIAVLMAMGAYVYASALAQSKVDRTRAIISKIDQLITEKYESYRTRPVPIRIAPGTRPDDAARLRLYALRDLMRMEMPDRQWDVIDGPAALPSGYSLQRPALQRGYYRKGNATWTANPSDFSNESAECLYLILSHMRDGEKNALDFLSPNEIGDLDRDGLNEILDAWGQPIIWYRWAPGHHNTALPVGFGGGATTPVTPQDVSEADYFDPLKVDPRWRDADANNNPYALKPLIVSSGPDRKFDLFLQIDFHYSQTGAAPYTSPCHSDPYVQPIPGNSNVYFGIPYDLDGDTYPDYTDNITNHDLEAR